MSDLFDSRRIKVYAEICVKRKKEILAEVADDVPVAYVDASVLAEINLMYYTVWVPYTQVYSNGKTENRETRCSEFTSNSTLDRDELMAEIEQAIADANEVVTDNENIVLYGQTE